MKKKNFNRTKIGLRFVQVLFVLAAVFGAVWQSTISMGLTIQQFMMLYGAIGAIVCEIGVRLLEWKFPESKLELEEDTEKEPEQEEE